MLIGHRLVRATTTLFGVSEPDDVHGGERVRGVFQVEGARGRRGGQVLQVKEEQRGGVRQVKGGRGRLWLPQCQ